MEKPEVFVWKNARLSAVSHKSKRPNAPTVIFHHGFGGTKVESHRMFVKCARQLAEKGIDSFRFDFYGSGDSFGNLSDATFSMWIENSLEAASAVRAGGSKKIVLLGFSLGGFVAAAAAPRVKPIGLVLWGPVFHPLKRILREKNLVLQARESGFADYQGEIINTTLVEDSARFKIPAMFEGYCGPCCVIYGTEDENALPSSSKNFAKFYRAQGGRVEMHSIKGANHSFDHHGWETEVIERTVNWISAFTS